MQHRWLRRTTVPLLSVLVAACNPTGTELEVRTFKVGDFISPDAAAQLVEPYVYRDRPDSPGSMSTVEGSNSIAVRETPDNLARIERVLKQLESGPGDRMDSTASQFRLHFQLVVANGSERSDPRIADIETALREALRYDGYTLAGEAFATVRPTRRFELWLEGKVAEQQRMYHIRGRFPNPLLSLLAVDFDRHLSTAFELEPGGIRVLGSVPQDGKTTLLIVRMDDA